MDSSTMKEVTPENPHVVCIPFPAQGHIKPMLNLAKLLHSKGFHITFVNTRRNHRRLTATAPATSSFQFEPLDDGLDPTDRDDHRLHDSPRDMVALCQAIMSNALKPPLKSLLSRLVGPSRPTCIVADMAMGFAMDVAEEVGISAGVFLETTNAWNFVANAKYRELVDMGVLPLKDESYLTNGYLETTKITDYLEVPTTMKDTPLKYMGTFLRTTDPDDLMLNAVMSNAIRALHSTAPILFNTFDALDQELLHGLSNTLSSPRQNLYPIGPLHLTVGRATEDQPNTLHGPIVGPSLWRQDPGCLQWLDSQPPNSVLYVNFGSIAEIPPTQIAELAWGLANSNQRFLWVIKGDDESNGYDQIPDGLLDEIGSRGFLARWCDQERVLAHKAVGGFLTHCGWNSTIEALSCGVPMLCWPIVGDQVINCWLCCERLGVGLDVESDFRREVVERLVRELLVGEKGEEMRKKALELKKMASEAIEGPNGSSFVNFEKVVGQIFSLSQFPNFS